MPITDKEDKEILSEIKHIGKQQTSKRIKKIIQQESTAWIGIKLNISIQHQIAIAIAQKYLQNIFGSEEDKRYLERIDNFDKDNKEGNSL